MALLANANPKNASVIVMELTDREKLAYMIGMTEVQTFWERFLFGGSIKQVNNFLIKRILEAKQHYCHSMSDADLQLFVDELGKVRDYDTKNLIWRLKNDRI